MIRLRGLLFALVGSIATIAAAFACCMVTVDYPGDVDQSRQDAVIVHHDGVEDLLIRVLPEFPGQERGPERLLWVLTLPNAPTHYEEVDEQVFADAKALVKKLVQRVIDARPKGDWKSADKLDAAALVIADPVRVGQFEITEVRAKVGQGAAAAAELNTFLTKSGYPAEPEGELRWFMERSFSFLCIQVFPPDGQDHFAAKISTPALRVTFPTDEPYYPAKYSARQGQFALNLTVLSSRPLSPKDLRHERDRLHSWVYYTNLWTDSRPPGALGTMVSTTAHYDGVSRWYVNSAPSFEGFNTPVDDDLGAIATWNDDVFFALGSDADAYDMPTPTWNRIAALLILGSLLGALAGAVIGMRKRRRTSSSPG